MNKEINNFIQVKAPAKVNLYLHVTGLRDNGFHELDSLVVFAESHDLITFRPGAGITFSLSGPMSHILKKTNNDNIVLKAARALAKRVGTDRVRGVEIQLEKFLPVAAGIGGGSADAAATLKGLSKFWEVDIDKQEIMEIARSLGADVPVCFEGRSAFFSGIGENITPISNFPELSILLVNPGVEILTSRIFNERKGPYNEMERLKKIPKEKKNFFLEIKKRRNDLEPVACSIAPIIKQVLESISSNFGCRIARMSGSGSTCFGLFDDITYARKAALEVKHANPDWWVVAGKTR